jgi:hypothetical protein
MKDKRQLNLVVRIGMFAIVVMAIVWGVLTPQLENRERAFDLKKLFNSRYSRYNPRSLYGPVPPQPTPVRSTEVPAKPGAYPHKAWVLPTPDPSIPNDARTPVHTEALHKIGATEYHSRGHIGEGVKVAVIDDEFKGWQMRVQMGELPTSVITQQFFSSSSMTATLTPSPMCPRL